MELLYFACLIIGGSCLALVGTVAASFYVGQFAFVGLVGLIILGLLIASRYVDLRVVYDTDAQEEYRLMQRKGRQARDWEKERLTTWGRSNCIQWCHRDNPLYPVHVLLKAETMADLTQTPERELEVVDWCDLQGIDMKRFSYTEFREQYDEMLSEVIRQHAQILPPMNAAFGYNQRLKEIEHLAPKPYLAFRTEDDAFSFRIRWL
ncbi:MAG: hypothetical protein EOP83_14300 [Verrucomicrobiaceae bacterium]|nr:MAG: hypothetical protein EOP83_14300 [Verrucomicrobiaceae bacterium]